MKDIKCAFVTGGTGLLGVNIVKELIQNTAAKIILLVRNPTQEKRDKFFKDLLAFGGGLWPVGFSFDRIRIAEGDVTLPHFGMIPHARTRLLRKSTSFTIRPQSSSFPAPRASRTRRAGKTPPASSAGGVFCIY